MTTVVSIPLHRVQVRHGRGFVKQAPVVRLPVRRPARVAVMLALAHSIDAAINVGRLRDQKDAAERLGLTRPRITQLLALLRLAPDLQERVLFQEAVDGQEPVTERELRPLMALLCWDDQRANAPSSLR
jgi:DNA-binding transcriptional regulator YdaS (Cro superfamily)